MALTKNLEVDHYVDQELRSYEVAAAKYVYKGGLIGLSTGGYAQPLTAGDPFIGIAYEEMDNSSGADGDVTVRVYTVGDFGMTLAGASTSYIGRPVFASDDATLTLVGAGNSYLGRVQDVVTAHKVVLRIDSMDTAVKTITHAVENLAAGGDIAARAIHSFDQEAWIVGARVVNQATAAAGIDNSNTCVIVLATGAGTVVSETFDSTTTFPAANADQDLGTLANEHATAGQVLTLAVTNGATADPGPFLIEVDYV